MLAGEELGQFEEEVAGASADADDVVLLAGSEEVVAEELTLDLDVVEVAPSHNGLNLSGPCALGDVEGHGSSGGADECSLVEVEQEDVPTFEWSKGHSGALLPCEVADKLIDLIA